MSEQVNKRTVLKGMAATGLALPLSGLASSRIIAEPTSSTNQDMLPQAQQPVRYVFASDPRAGLPEFQVMPG